MYVLIRRQSIIISRRIRQSLYWFFDYHRWNYVSDEMMTFLLLNRNFREKVISVKHFLFRHITLDNQSISNILINLIISKHLKNLFLFLSN